MRCLYFLCYLSLCSVLLSCSSTHVIMDQPEFAKHYMSKEAALAKENAYADSFTIKMSLIERKEADKEDLTSWFKRNKFLVKAHCSHDSYTLKALNAFDVTDWAMSYPTYIHNDRTYHLSHIVEQSNLILAFYGGPRNEFHVIEQPSLLIVRDILTKEVKRVYDFKNYGMSPDYLNKDKAFVYQKTLWAQVEGSTLYVLHAHSTYSKSTRNKNGYITAINMNTNKVLWRSAPMVANATNFLIKDNLIFTAYGFTNEPLSVYTLDKATGSTIGALALEKKNSGKKLPGYLMSKGSVFYLKTSDRTEYTFKMN